MCRTNENHADICIWNWTKKIKTNVAASSLNEDEPCTKHLRQLYNDFNKTVKYNFYVTHVVVCIHYVSVFSIKRVHNYLIEILGIYFFFKLPKWIWSNKSLFFFLNNQGFPRKKNLLPSKCVGHRIGRQSVGYPPVWGQNSCISKYLVK